jgi:hypothetical protein
MIATAPAAAPSPIAAAIDLKPIKSTPFDISIPTAKVLKTGIFRLCKVEKL